MEQFDNVSVIKKANVYFDGRCVSHSLILADGVRKSVGVILPGATLTFNTGAPAHARAATQQIAEALAPLGIEYTPEKGGPGPDISPFAAQGLSWAWLAQDGSDYFDLHHNADDTLDKIDPKALAQNVAAYTVFAYLAAEADGDFGSAVKAPANAATK